MRIAHLQAQCAPGQFELNARKVLEGLEREIASYDD